LQQRGNVQVGPADVVRKIWAGKGSATLKKEEQTCWLERGKAGEVGGGDGLLLDQDVKALAHAFGEDQSFELEAGAKPRGIVHASIVEIREIISLA